MTQRYPVKTHTLANNLKLVDLAPPISGFKDFFGAYVLEAREVALIDVGPAVCVENLLSGLTELNINLEDVSYIIATHIHLDHAGGIGQAIKQMPKAKVIVHERGRRHLIDPARLWQESQRVLGNLALKYGPPEPVPQDRIIVAKEGELLDLGEMEIEVLDTPGHASHHLSFVDRQEGRLFTGDAAGIYIRGLTMPDTVHPFNLEQTLTSLDKLIRLGATTLYYAHFGYADHATDRLRYYKQQLVSWGKVIADCLEKEAGWQEIYDELRGKDSALAQIDDLPASERRRGHYLVKNSIMGFISYFQRYGTEYIKQCNP